MKKVITISLAFLWIVSCFAQFNIEGKNGNSIAFSGIKSADADNLYAMTLEQKEIKIPWRFIADEEYKHDSGFLHDAYLAANTRGYAMLGWGYYSGKGVPPYRPSQLIPVIGDKYIHVVQDLSGRSMHSALAILYPNDLIPRNDSIGYTGINSMNPFKTNTTTLKLRERISDEYGLGVSLFRYRFPNFSLEIILSPRDSEGHNGEGISTTLIGSGPEEMYEHQRSGPIDPFAAPTTSSHTFSGFDIRYIHFLEQVVSQHREWDRDVIIDISNELRTACMRYRAFLTANTAEALTLNNNFFIEEPRK